MNDFMVSSYDGINYALTKLFLLINEKRNHKSS